MVKIDGNVFDLHHGVHEFDDLCFFGVFAAGFVSHTRKIDACTIIVLTILFVT